MNETSGPRIDMTPRLAAYREMESIEIDCSAQPTIQLRGRTWEVLSTGLSRAIGNRRVSIPIGDLFDAEVFACLDAMRQCSK